MVQAYCVGCIYHSRNILYSNEYLRSQTFFIIKSELKQYRYGNYSIGHRLSQL